MDDRDVAGRAPLQETPPEQKGEDTSPGHEQQLVEEADARSDSAYNDPIGGMPIA